MIAPAMTTAEHDPATLARIRAFSARLDRDIAAVREGVMQRNGKAQVRA